MKKRFIVLLTSLFMGLLFAISLNTSAKAATPAWECSSSKGNITLSGDVCFFNSEGKGYRELFFNLSNSGEDKFLNIYYTDIVHGTQKVEVKDGINEYQLPFTVKLGIEEIQTVKISYILASNPSKIQNIYLDVMEENDAPKVSVEITSDKATSQTSATANFTVTEKRQDDVGLKEVKALWVKESLFAPTAASFADKENLVTSDGWVTELIQESKFEEADVSGNYQLCVLAVDFAGNSTITCSENAKIDTLGPTIKYGTLEDLSKWYSEYKVPYTVFDDSGDEVDVRYFVNGEEIESENGLVLNADNAKDGENEVYIEATDSLGNTSKTEAITIKIINTPLTYEENYEGEEYNGVYKDLSFTYVITVNSPLAYKVHTQVNDSEWSVSENWMNDIVRIGIGSEGIHVINVKIVDEAGRIVEFSSKEIEIDKSTPVVTIKDLIGANENGWHNQELEYTLNVESEEGYTLTYSVDGENWLPYNQEEVISYVKSQNGLVQVEIKATDRVGHEGKAILEVSIDSKTEEISAIWSGALEVANQGSVEITVIIENAISPITSTAYIDIEAETENAFVDNKFTVTKNGSYAIKVVDAAGNITFREIEVTNFYDFSNDYSLVVLDEAWTNGNVTVNLVDSGNSEVTGAVVEHNRVSVHFDLDAMSFEADENGKYIVAFENAAGYVGTLEIEINNIDREADAVTITDNNTGNWIGKYVFSVNVETNGNSPVEKVSYAFVKTGEAHDEADFVEIEMNKEISIDNISGEYYLHVMSKDAAGNITHEITSKVCLDGSLPVDGQIIATPSEYTNEDIVVSFLPFENVIVDGEVIHYYRISKLGEEQPEFVLVEDINSVIVISEEGEYLVELKGVNEFDKESTIALLVVKDVTAPELNLNSVYDENKYNSQIEVEVEVNEETAVVYQIVKDGEEIDETAFVVLEGNKIVKTDLESGKYNVVVRATDLAGNVSETSIFLDIDTQKPVIELTGSIHIYDKGQEIELTVTDNVEVKEVRYILTKEETENPDVSKGFAIEGNTIVLPEIEDGKYYLYIEVEDVAGNKTVVSQSIILDSTAPTVEGVVNNGFYQRDLEIKVAEITMYETLLNGQVVTLSEDILKITENGYYSLVVTDYLGHKTEINFVVNKEGKAIVNAETVTVSNQKYLPILKDKNGYYVELPKGNYPEKKILVFTKLVAGDTFLLKQDPNYLYLSSSVRDELKDGYRFEVTDESAMATEANSQGYYGYVVVNTMSLDQAGILGINPTVIDNKAASLITGLTGVISILGIFVINRSRRLIRI